MDEPSDEMLEDARQINEYVRDRNLRTHAAHVLLSMGYLDANTLAVFRSWDAIKGITYCSHPRGDN